MNYSISIILPILNEINSLKKTLLIINKINVDKEFIVIYSEKLTNNSVKDEINSLKKKYKNFRCFKQIKPFVGGAIDLGIIKATKKHIAIMASDMETNPYELKNMINVSSKNNKSIVSADRWISNKGFSDYGVIKFLANFAFQKLLKIFFNYNILDFTYRLTDPILRKIRGFLPNLGVFDISPIILLVLIEALKIFMFKYIYPYT